MPVFRHSHGSGNLFIVHPISDFYTILSRFNDFEQPETNIFLDNFSVIIIT
jgi:hypothetical protein